MIPGIGPDGSFCARVFSTQNSHERQAANRASNGLFGRGDKCYYGRVCEKVVVLYLSGVCDEKVDFAVVGVDDLGRG